MRKKALSVLLTTAMVATMFTACGKDDNKPGSTTNPGDQHSEANHEYTISNDGKTLVIQCWNDEFRNRITDHFPGYTKVDDANGTIGDIKVVWITTPSDNGAYQDKLDQTLPKNLTAAADDKTDMFLMEADYALKYVDSNYTVPVEKLGITKEDIKNQYKYTQDVVTDANGQLKGLSWQGCPGILFYNREAAKDIFGTDDQATVQAAVKDWATYMTTAKDVVAKGYKMQATTNDSFRVYSNNVTSKWVTDNKVSIDKNIKQWAEDAKALYDMGACSTEDLWSKDWEAGFYPEGKVLCYFGPAWLINFCMAAGSEGSIANQGGWAPTEGPQGFFWGGTWIAAADGTDNADLVKEIMLKMTTDESIMTGIVKKDDDFVNNKPAMDAMAKDAEYKSAVMGGVNPLPFYTAGVEKIDLSNLSGYDQGCNETFQAAMKEYFLGNKSYDEAVQYFYEELGTKYPGLDMGN